MTFEDMTFGSYDNAEQKARKAYELYEDGNISQALLELNAALEINPSNSSWHFNKALALDSVNQFEEAISEYEIALQLNPLDVEILNSLAIDHTRLGQYDMAISIFEHIQQLSPEFEPGYCNRIITYTEMDQHDLAEQMFYLAQQINPDCPLCYYNIGNSLFIRGDYKKAIHCWLKTTELEPSHPQINYRIAQAYWSDDQSSLAHQYFLAELRLNPGDVDVILDFGLFLLQLGNIESAKEKFNRILELVPDHAMALFYLGELAFNNNDYEKAVELFGQALEIDSTLSGPYYRLAQYALMKGRKQKAQSYLLTELEFEPADADILVSMGSMFLSLDDFEHAIYCLLKAIETDNGNADAYYYLGCVHAAKEQLVDAAEFFGHALDINPEHINTLRDSAVVCLMLGRITKAAERINKAMGLNEADPQLKVISRKIRFAQTINSLANFHKKAKY